MKKECPFRWGDLLAVAAVLLLAVVIFLLCLPGQRAQAAYADIYQNGKLILTVSLAQDREIPISGNYNNTVTVKDGKIAITASDCPGEDCVHIGWIETSGRSIVCLPNGLEIRVVADHGEVDFVVG